MARATATVRFDRMTPIVKEPFAPDDDAVAVTNAREMRFFLERSGCTVEEIACTDRYVWGPLDFALNLTPLRYLMFNAFVVARRHHRFGGRSRRSPGSRPTPAQIPSCFRSTRRGS
jgi:hypothetical protein